MGIRHLGIGRGNPRSNSAIGILFLLTLGALMTFGGVLTIAVSAPRRSASRSVCRTRSRSACRRPSGRAGSM